MGCLVKSLRKHHQIAVCQQGDNACLRSVKGGANKEFNILSILDFKVMFHWNSFMAYTLLDFYLKRRWGTNAPGLIIYRYIFRSSMVIGHPNLTLTDTPPGHISQEAEEREIRHQKLFLASILSNNTQDNYLWGDIQATFPRQIERSNDSLNLNMNYDGLIWSEGLSKP